MRIVHTLDYWAEGYGRPQAVSFLASGQQRLGHETHLLAGEVFGNRDLEAFRHFSPDEHHKKSIARKKSKEWQEWLLGRVEEISPDIIHTHELADAWALTSQADVPVIFSIRVDHRFGGASFDVLEAARRADWVEYWNPDISGWLRQGGVKNTSWNCAPVVLEKTVGIERVPGLIISQGRIDDNKNQRALVDVFPEVLRQVPYAQLVLVGEGPEREGLEDLVAEIGLRDRIIFTGWQGNIAPFLAKASLAVYLAGQMGFDRAVMEAMYLGTPVIVSEALSPVIHYGKYGQVASREDLAAKIIDLLQHGEDFLAQTKSARLLARSEYSERAVLERTLSLYRHVLEQDKT